MYLQHRKGKEGENSHFKEQGKEGTLSTQTIKGVLKGLYYNEAKEVDYSGGSFTAPENVNVVIENTESNEVYNVKLNVRNQKGTLDYVFTPTINSLLGCEQGAEVQLYTQKNKEGFSTIKVQHPTEKETITYKDKETGEEKSFETNKSYPWAFSKETNTPLPEVMRKKPKDGQKFGAVSDDDDRYEFLIEAVKNWGGSSEAFGEEAVVAEKATTTEEEVEGIF